MGDEVKLLLCYNLGCGQQYDPNDNGPESCRHHIGVPVFHDAYKGWSCCKKKCTDFTEFLNIKGCNISYHSNVKPPEPEKAKENGSNKDEVIVYKALEQKLPKIERPPFTTPLILLKPEVSPKLKEDLQNLKLKDDDTTAYDGSGSIPIGTQCKNNNCNTTYDGPDTLKTNCTNHPGYPVFHEGLKFWSCCTKRTTDFNSFLQQVGCTVGEHVWFKKKIRGEVKCRLDWHQTGANVFISVFGKRCNPETSTVELSPVRLKMNLSFPEQGGMFQQDMELRGIVDVEKSSVSMLPTKVEIKLKKMMPGAWSKLEIPLPVTEEPPKPSEEEVESNTETDEVDLSFI